jgi:hypothetical protein
VFCVFCGSILLSIGQTAYRQFAALARDRQAAVAGLTRELAADHSAEGIRVTLPDLHAVPASDDGSYVTGACCSWTAV